MTTGLSGIDLARQALIAAQEAAKKNGAGRAKKPRRRTGPAVRRDGREPLGLGAAISVMMTERGPKPPRPRRHGKSTLPERPPPSVEHSPCRRQEKTCT
ncbi:hypothetical protein ACFU76_13010 [Streptomyces sp. NPDC057539]|uniref:hypothetical protein n=1 Tax=Streptomyces sp. NPDC057539 TaxID=3346159 RepID=UPI0036B0FB6D